MNRIYLDKKTPTQKMIELITTNGRCYETVPYIHSLGNKIALRTWLKFSKKRFFYSHHYQEQPNFLERSVAGMLECIRDAEKMSERYLN